MKVLFKHMISGYIGRADDLIFYWDRRTQRILARRRPQVQLTEQHTRFGDIARNLMRLRPSAGYKDDLRAYGERSYKVPEFRGIQPYWNNLFFRLMYALQRQNPLLDLRSIDRDTIFAQDLPCVSVRRAVEAGLLPVVRDYQTLTREL